MKNDKMKDDIEKILPKLKVLKEKNNNLSDLEIVKYLLDEFDDKEKLNEILKILKINKNDNFDNDSEIKEKCCPMCESNDIFLLEEKVNLEGQVGDHYRCNSCNEDFYLLVDDVMPLD